MAASGLVPGEAVGSSGLYPGDAHGGSGLTPSGGSLPGTPTVVGSIAVDNGSNPKTTSTFTPTADALLIAVAGSSAGNTEPTPSGHGVTWTYVGRVQLLSSDYLHAWYGNVTGTPAAAGVAFASPGAEFIAQIIEIPNGSVVQSKMAGPTTDPAATFDAAFAANSITVAGGAGSNDTVDPEANLTVLLDQGFVSATGMGMSTGWKNGEEATVTFNDQFATANNACVAFEVGGA